SGCSASYWPGQAPATPDAVGENPAGEGTSKVAPVPVTDGQIDRIVHDIAKVARISDEELDAEKLEDRFTGAALEQRAANYKIRDAVSDYEVVLPRIT